MPTLTLTLDLPDEMIQKLKVLADRENITVPEYIVRLYELWAQANDRQLEFEFTE